MASTTTEPVPASRTRSVLLVVLASTTGVFFHILYGPATDAPNQGVPVMGFVGFVAGAVVALMLGSVIGAVAGRRGQRQGGRY